MQKESNSINRRTFFKTTAGAAATAALIGTASEVEAKEKKKIMSKPIGVYNEWDKVTSMVVGDASHPVLPEMSYVIEEYAAISDEMKAEVIAYSGQRYDKLHPEIWEKITAQQDDLADIIEEEGIEVFRPNTLSDEQIQGCPVGNWQLYPRDPMLAVGPYLIELCSRTPFKRKEIWGIREALIEKASETGQRHISMPEPAREIDLVDERQPYLEGGDIFVMDKDIVIGHSGIATSYAGIEWLTRFLEPEGYRVHTVELTKEWLHLDCVFATPRRGLMMSTLERIKKGI